jgi:hypothetical protein
VHHGSADPLPRLAAPDDLVVRVGRGGNAGAVARLRVTSAVTTPWQYVFGSHRKRRIADDVAADARRRCARPETVGAVS